MLRDTAMAVADAPSATIAIRSSNCRTNSSSTKTAPAIGALKAVASPAPAPAASSTLQSTQSRRNKRPILFAMLALICTLGPSRPSASPEPMASTPPMNFTGTKRIGAGFKVPFNTASTCGIPLPAACGEYRRTSQAAREVAVAHTTSTKRNPASL